LPQHWVLSVQEGQPSLAPLRPCGLGSAETAAHQASGNDDAARRRDIAAANPRTADSNLRLSMSSPPFSP
jgi:hypothetical protein